MDNGIDLNFTDNSNYIGTPRTDTESTPACPLPAFEHQMQSNHVSRNISNNASDFVIDARRGGPEAEVLQLEAHDVPSIKEPGLPIEVHDAPPIKEPGLPIEAPFAAPLLPVAFWQDLFTLLLIGGALGAFGVGYIKTITDFPLLWTTTYGIDNFPEPKTLGFACGEPWWIGVGAACGLMVGLTKAALQLDEFPSFIEEVRSGHVEPLTSVKVTVCALLSLMGGASLGPEAGLGAFGGAVGQVVATRVRKNLPEVRRKLYVVASISGAFSAFLPSPFTSTLITTELGVPPHEWGISCLHMVTLYSVAATAGFLVYYAIQGYTYLNPQALYKSASSATLYNQNYVFIGVLFGFMGASLAVCFFLIGGIVKNVVSKIKAAVEARVGRWPRVVIIAILGGTFYGVFMYVFPLTIGDGSVQLSTVLSEPGAIGSSVLAASCFAKMLTYHVCNQTGFVGGIFFPCIIMGSMMGGVFQNITGVNPVVAVSCSFVCMCAAFIPMPFMLVILTTSSLMVGPQGFIPIFTTVITAYLFCIGVGVPQGMLALSAKKQQEQPELIQKPSSVDSPTPV
ncbi:hypothetical protein CEUSTIGMA_g8949.t1 [Chlamydomonas eustigma]|uniref:Chloride channel protein n=1 Tax=Chlamydomonas eustigma TaxID=1157962 RepID=A0A250XEP0_9CHLO|nr:hypothetical protein CEUSTIGMA_g8949.t1 [Chlamydomonas eustigma]|eukprot:GAX81521.1 hypothetical protein CEUSTIGMA_g8949.t1 [Chlamydomonas eustigma]